VPRKPKLRNPTGIYGPDLQPDASMQQAIDRVLKRGVHLVKLQPWDVQVNEPALWYSRFDIYRRIGPEHRGMLTAINVVQDAAGKQRYQYVPKTWADAALKWRWYDRAQAWDAELARELRDAEKDDKLKQRETRKLLLEVYTQKLVDGIANLDPKKSGWRTITDGLNMVLTQSRIENDDEPTQRRLIQVEPANPQDDELKKPANKKEQDAAMVYSVEVVRAMIESGLIPMPKLDGSDPLLLEGEIVPAAREGEATVEGV
jgi:hypothetical protein